MALVEELNYFNTIKCDLLQHNKGQFALIKGHELYGTFTTWDEAFKTGTTLFGNVPFLVKLVQEREEVAQTPALSTGVICAHV